jgi:hypothetical protein
MLPVSFTRPRARRPTILKNLIINYHSIDKRICGKMQPESRRAPGKPRPFLEKFLLGTNLLTATRTLINIKNKIRPERRGPAPVALRRPPPAGRGASHH